MPQSLSRLVILRKGTKISTFKSLSSSSVTATKKSMINNSEMKSLLSFIGLSSGARSFSSSSSSGKSTEELEQKIKDNPGEMTNAEWRDVLDGQTFHVTREAGTERPWSSCLNDEKRPGIFGCACCKRPLFESTTKFNSGTGWPSFWSPIQNPDGKLSVKYERDTSLFMARVEVLCSTCDAHLG